MDARPLPHLRSRCTLPPLGESEPTLRAAVALLRVCAVGHDAAGARVCVPGSRTHPVQPVVGPGRVAGCGRRAARPGVVVRSGGVDVDFACHPGPVQQDSDGGSD